jgi:hypothetical protein
MISSVFGGSFPYYYKMLILYTTFKPQKKYFRTEGVGQISNSLSVFFFKPNAEASSNAQWRKIDTGCLDQTHISFNFSNDMHGIDHNDYFIGFIINHQVYLVCASVCTLLHQRPATRKTRTI